MEKVIFDFTFPIQCHSDDYSDEDYEEEAFALGDCD